MLPRVLGWALFAVWSTWAFALQARLTAGSGSAAFVPDVGLVLALSLLARLEERDLPILAVVVALTRSAFSSEPAIALLAGTLGLSLLAMAVRSVVELTGPLWRTITTAALVAAFDLWLAGAGAPRAGSVGAGPAISVGALLAVGISSGLLALFAGPALAHLPGLSPLRSRKW
jgi:hypothetical protein